MESNNQPEPNMSENKDENQNPEPEPWKDLPPMERLPAPYEQFRRDVEPYAVDLDFWQICKETDSPDAFLVTEVLATEGDDWSALQNYERKADPPSFSHSRNRNHVETGGDLFVIAHPDSGYINRYLYRFLDGGFALVGSSHLEDAHLEIVSLSDLAGHKLYVSEDILLSENRINELWDKVERFGQFAKDQVKLLRENKEITWDEEEAGPEKTERAVAALYRSKQAASVHRAAVWFRCWKEGKIKDPFDPEEAPE